jgi:hypothetical protein
VNDFADQTDLFDDRCNLLEVSPGVDDAAGGRTEVLSTRYYNVRCYVEDAYAAQPQALQVAGFMPAKFVFLTFDPGLLAQGSVAEITRSAGADLDPPERYRVKRVARASLGDAALWRVECEAMG